VAILLEPFVFEIIINNNPSDMKLFKWLSLLSPKKTEPNIQNHFVAKDKKINTPISTAKFKYFSAKDGTFDKTYFINPDTNKFQFPKYNKDNNRFLVQIKDITNYKETYFDGYDKKEKDNFSFEDFEQTFFPPELEIESFEDFLENLKSNNFDKQLGKEASLTLFTDFEDFLNENDYDGEPISLNINLAEKINECGYIKISSEKITQVDYLANLSILELTNLCKSNNIEPYKTKKAILNQLSDVSIDIPYVFATPTQDLKNYFLKFIELYTSELKKNADRFHPLYIETILEETSLSNDNEKISQVFKNELKSEYWKNRLEERAL